MRIILKVLAVYEMCSAGDIVNVSVKPANIYLFISKNTIKYV